MIDTSLAPALQGSRPRRAARRRPGDGRRLPPARKTRYRPALRHRAAARGDDRGRSAPPPRWAVLASVGWARRCWAVADEDERRPGPRAPRHARPRLRPGRLDLRAGRTRLQTTGPGLLDVVFERAPSAWAPRPRPALPRVNDRLAEINGLPAARISAARSPSCCPISPRWGRRRARGADRRAADRGRGRATRRPSRARPPVARLVLAGAGAATALIGVGIASSRSPSGAPPSARCARRPTATRRCWSRCRTPARAWSCSSATAAAVRQRRVRAAQRLHVPELAAMESVLDLVGRGRRRGGAAARARGSTRGRPARAPTDPAAARRRARRRRGRRRAARRRGTAAPARGRRARRHRPPPGRDRARAPARPGRDAGRGQRAVRPVARRGADDASVAGLACATWRTRADRVLDAAGDPGAVAVARDEERQA